MLKTRTQRVGVGGVGVLPQAVARLFAQQNKYFWRLHDSKMVSENVSDVISLNKTNTSTAQTAFGTTHVMVSAFGSFHTTHQKAHLAQKEMCQMDF